MDVKDCIIKYAKELAGHLKDINGESALMKITYRPDQNDFKDQMIDFMIRIRPLRSDEDDD